MAIEDMLHRKAAIQKSFSKIGKSNGSAAPDSTDNRASIAWELFVSKELAGMAAKRYDAAKEAAKEAGIIDEEKVQEGTEVNVYDNEHFNISLKKSASSLLLDKTMLSNNLQKGGMSKADVDKLLVSSSKQRKGATNINISFKD